MDLGVESADPLVVERYAAGEEHFVTTTNQLKTFVELNRMFSSILNDCLNVLVRPFSWKSFSKNEKKLNILQMLKCAPDRKKRMHRKTKEEQRNLQISQAPSKEYFIAKIGVDNSENGPLKVSER